MACLNNEFKDFGAKNFYNVFGGMNVTTGAGRDNVTVVRPGEAIKMMCADGMMLSTDSTLDHVDVSISQPHYIKIAFRLAMSIVCT